ncbi:MAG TPA: PspC domain-containing protein [Streptosporangiaceae bacterium]|nr:PspC domain-containing protein [Streptosporangiaceae bacterium]
MSTTNSSEPAGQPRAQSLYRPLDDRMLGGVASGVARYVGVDVTIVRIVLAVFAVMGGAAIPVYLAGWLLIPEEGAEQSIAGQFIQPHHPSPADVPPDTPAR